MNTPTILIFSAICLSIGGLVVRLLWPQRQKPDQPDDWAQHNEQRMPSMESSDEAPFDNVERGFNIAFRGGE